MTGIGRRIRKLPVNVALKLRFPSASDDAKAVDELSDLEPILNGKRIAVVGNAASIFQHAYGSEIEEHDTVIRMNHGYVRSPESQGLRTDVLCLACQLSKAEVARFNPKFIVFTGRRRDVMKFSMATGRHRLLFAPRIIWSDLRCNFDVRGPSTGLIVIELLTRFFTPARVTLFGFDWMRSKTFYHNEKCTQWHEWDRERDLVMRWIAEAPDRRFLRNEASAEAPLDPKALEKNTIPIESA